MTAVVAGWAAVTLSSVSRRRASGHPSRQIRSQDRSNLACAEPAMMPRRLAAISDAQSPTSDEIKTDHREVPGNHAWRRQSCADGRNLSLILRRERGCLGVVEANRSEPVAGSDAVMEMVKKAGAVLDVRHGIERLLQSGEGIRMCSEVNLHAADVKEGHGSGGQGLAGPRDCLSLAGEEDSTAIGIDRPGPWSQRAGRCGAAAFDLRHDAEQAARGIVMAFCGCNGGKAKI